MVNPLSRVAMKNIIEKERTEEKHSDNFLVSKKVKTLSDFVENKEKINNTENRDSHNKHNFINKKTDRIDNNTKVEADEEIKSLIKNIIDGEVKVKGINSIDNAVTLKEAAERAKQ